MVNYMAGGEFLVNIFKGNAHFNHKHHNMISKVGNFINCLLFIVCFSGNYNLCAFFADLFKNFINSFFKKIGGVRAFFLFGLSAFNKVYTQQWSQDWKRSVFSPIPKEDNAK